MKPKTLALLAMMGSPACAGDTVIKPPAALANWHSLDTPNAAQASCALTATELERRIVPDYIVALSTSDFATLPAVIDEHAHFSFAGMNDVNGRNSVVRAHRIIFDEFDARHFAVARVLVSPDAQAVEWTMTARHVATQRPVIVEGLTLLWTRNNGTIKDVHLYFDQSIVNAQIGRGPHASAPTRPIENISPDKAQVQDASDFKLGSENIAKVQAWVGALENNTATEYLSDLSDHVTVVTNDASFSRKSDQAGYFTAVHAAIDDLDTQLDSIWSVGPYVIVEYHLLGEQKGPLGWIPAQKNTLVKLYNVDICELDGGKIVRVRRYNNPLQLLASSQREAP